MSSEAIKRAKDTDIEDTLKEAINLFHSDENGSYWSGQFVDMHVKLGVARYNDATLESMYRELTHISQDMWTISTLITRLEWLRNILIRDQPTPFLWSQFASVDIEYFHVTLRSILDYVASILVNLAIEPKQVPSGSFHGLYEWLNKNPRNRVRLGKEVSELVSSASWYSEVRVIRDAIVHRGAYTLVFGSPTDGILFQVVSGLQARINIGTLMWNDNIVDFQLYASLYLAKTLVFLERFGKLLAGRVAQQEPNPKGAKSYWLGFGLMRNWINKLLAKLEG